jgi:hypothetical protein
MSSERWQQLEDVFHAALDRAPADREAFVAGACGGDAGLREEVDRLLRGHEQASIFVAQAEADVERVAATALPDRRQIGAYRIVRELGRGGMGRLSRRARRRAVPDACRDQGDQARHGHRCGARSERSHVANTRVSLDT